MKNDNQPTENKAGLKTAVKSGRAFNGFENDRGKIVHLVPPMPYMCGGYWGDKSLCGIHPGRRSNGWSEVNRDVTCPKCIKKIN
ncbi:MAG: hypothetical protein ABIN91_11180 [Mucilaginibacter sp.]|uniref:hypothetical protein n=1 Tax=Mucilaginibacter sp. TaxID=1882438 RepID=UPI003267DB61